VIVLDLDKIVRDVEDRGTFGAAYAKKDSIAKMQVHTSSLHVDISGLGSRKVMNGESLAV
jgi:hypothetical protein